MRKLLRYVILSKECVIPAVCHHGMKRCENATLHWLFSRDATFQGTRAQGNSLVVQVEGRCNTIKSEKAYLQDRNGSKLCGLQMTTTHVLTARRLHFPTKISKPSSITDNLNAFVDRSTPHFPTKDFDIFVDYRWFRHSNNRCITTKYLTCSFWRRNIDLSNWKESNHFQNTHKHAIAYVQTSAQRRALSFGYEHVLNAANM